MDASRLSALLVSHICHDLASPANALSMMWEARQDPEMTEQADQVITQSAAALEQKLVFLRYALGSVGLQNGEADLQEIKKLTSDFLRQHKIETDWRAGETPLTFGQARLLMNMAMIAGSTLGRGGVLVAAAERDGEKLVLKATGGGARLRVGDALISALQGNEPEGGWNARNVQPYFTRMIAAELGGALSFEHNDEKVEISTRIDA